MKQPEKYKGLAYLAMLLVILPLAVWSLALRGTVSKWREYRKLGYRLVEMQTRQPGGGTGVSPTEGTGIDIISGGEFIEAISETVEKNKLTVEKYTPYLTHRGDNASIMTAGIEVSGEFSSIVRLVDFIEKKIKSCRLISLDLHGTKERRTGDVKLTAIIYIQQVITD